MARPGRNVTGFWIEGDVPLIWKQLELLKDDDASNLARGCHHQSRRSEGCFHGQVVTGGTRLDGSHLRSSSAERS
jgi:hypothetical protein